MLNRIVSVSLLVFIAVSSVFLFCIAVLIWLVTVLFDRRLLLLHRFTSFWAALYLWVMPAWSVSVEGREKILNDQTCVVVSNHQSQLDILVAFRIFFHFKWVAKTEVFRLPLIGWNMTLNRYIRLKRGDRESIRQMFDACKKTLAQGSSVYIFPEGTRSETGIMRPFKPGAFILARQMRVPILPIVINGTKAALPKHSLNISGKHHIRVRVLDEIPYDEFRDLTPEALAEQVRDRLAREIDEHIAAGENEN
ncbi:1-acyl-sn-glycerol-3-phosphate acyltransferase [Desulfonema ishimotonii]|uniref:1-acyl-sn-glycerol-3-phosphate acyltransferase n=1 Tax=Desulfonema ishimotonii TaxID=45657 RepID=A0A401FT18_9BACT|nr:lysophospholipid acyltransferase family protein [Desulfonema ishimotonii]GBC60108.1 1-acyl-sn-glycerol-3-phosphate acyltransferase [Desulfonema ishimotonii]